MFQDVRLRGGSASILWGYRTAVAIKSWAILKQEGQWMLKASLERVDPFQARQKPLLFTAPNKTGYWCWPILGDLEVGPNQRVGPNQLVARLGPPER